MRQFAKSGLLLALVLGLTGAAQPQGSTPRDASRSGPSIGASDTIALGLLGGSSEARLRRAFREALRAALDESPYLNLLPDTALQGVLRDDRSPRSAEELARICGATRARVYITGAVTAEGTGFAGRLTAIDCLSKATLAHEDLARNRARFIDALGQAAGRLRVDLGEPPTLVRKFSTPLSRATSNSFEALEAWSSGLQLWRTDGPAAALSPLDAAVKADPSFAAATYDLGLASRNSGQEERARELFIRAFSMREHASSRKRLNIAAQYHAFVTVDEKLATEAFRVWIRAYPNDYKAVSNLASFYGDLCRYDEAIAEFERARAMNPSDVIPHEDLMEMLLATGKLERASSIYQEIRRMGLDDDSPHLYMYVIAALRNDVEEMARQSSWFGDKKELQHEILSEEADAAAYYGHLARARELTERAAHSAQEAQNAEQAATTLLNGAWREALFGSQKLAHEQAARALTISPGSREGAATAALILARTGDISQARSLVADLEKRYPNHSVMQQYWLPSIRAQIALQQSDISTALNELRSAAPLDLLYPQVFFYSHMPTVVLRAEAYTLSGQHRQAVKEWETILQNPGITQLSASAPFARLELARGSRAAATGNSSASPSARKAYLQFLDLWKDADADIPLLQQARAEFARLP